MGKMKDLDIDNMNDYEDSEPTDAELKKMLRDEHVKTEAEFKDKILEGWDEVLCYACYRPLKLTEAIFINEVPYHKYCA